MLMRRGHVMWFSLLFVYLDGKTRLLALFVIESLIDYFLPWMENETMVMLPLW
jgi:hypothetical protein